MVQPSPSRSEPAMRTLDELLVSSGAGDRAAFTELYRRHAPLLHGLALRMTRQPSVAADAVHDAFVQVWQRAGSFDPARGPAEGWLASLLRYRAIDLMRRGGREQTGLDLPETADPGPDAFEALAGARDGQALHRCLEALPSSQRQVVMLAFLDGLSHPELAARLAAPLGTVKSWVRRALLALRGCLEP